MLTLQKSKKELNFNLENLETEVIINKSRD